MGASLPTLRSLIEKTFQGFSDERRVCSYAKSVINGPLAHLCRLRQADLL